MRHAVLIVDDEPLARARVRDLLSEHPGLELVGEAADGIEAVSRIDQLEPDIVFLDIQMPGVSGLEVLKKIRHQPAIIFTTAHDRYAVAAFELAAVDYLLKPFGPERFRAAVERVLATQERTAAGPRALEALGSTTYVERLFVRDRGRIVPIAAPDIIRLEASDDYVAVHAGGRAHLMHITLTELEKRLDPARFLRIHRTHIVNLDHLKSIEPHDGARMTVQMRDGSKLMASRARSRTLRSLAR